MVPVLFEIREWYTTARMKNKRLYRIVMRTFAALSINVASAYFVGVVTYETWLTLTNRAVLSIMAMLTAIYLEMLADDL
jgi:hypothetical protein